jgi:hypothetical protein
VGGNELNATTELAGYSFLRNDLGRHLAPEPQDYEIRAELRCVSFFQLLPRYQRREKHPAVLRVKCAAKGQIELLDR